MPEISLTEDQRARLEAVRRDVEEAFVDTYGHARLEDAVEYLLDTYTPPDERGVDGAVAASDRVATAEYPALQRVASDVPDVPGSGIDADEMRGKLLSELGPEKLAARLEAADGADDDPPDDDGEDDETGGSATDADGSPDDAADAAPDAGGGGLLATANRLLDDHDDKWREAAGDTPYEVDLPDGSTESARTKDDVRQLLFRHY